MYESFFRLDYRPFAVLPDSGCVFWANGHRNALSVVEIGLGRLSQVTVLTGGIGAGKTTLLRHLLDVAPPGLSMRLLSDFTAGRGDLLSGILSAFALDISPDSDAVLMRRLERHLADQLDAGRRCVLVIDQAQCLAPSDLEILRQVSSLNTAQVAIMLVLVGHPRLRATLTRSENGRLAQRIGADYHLGPLTAEETAGYVRHRIRQAGGSADLFDSAALAEVHAITGGVPRKINVLCDLCLALAHAEDALRVDASIVRSVLQDAGRRETYTTLTEREETGPDGAAASEPAARPPARNPLRRRAALSQRRKAAPDRPQAAGPVPPVTSVEPAAAEAEQIEVPAEIFGFASWSDDIWEFVRRSWRRGRGCRSGHGRCSPPGAAACAHDPPAGRAGGHARRAAT